MNKKEKINLIIQKLNQRYPDAHCSLIYSKPYELLIATRLSAQCTDARVNLVTPVLFSEYPTLESLAEADYNRICDIVRSCGFYHGKAKSIIEISRALLEKYNGKLPDSIEQLTQLSGVGRKTANLIMGDIFGQPAIIADTHCIRISNRLGLVKSNNPLIVEKQLKNCVPPEHQTKMCHNFVSFGRDICNAKSPKCSECDLKNVCTFFKQISKK